MNPEKLEQLRASIERLADVSYNTGFIFGSLSGLAMGIIITLAVIAWRKRKDQG